MLRLATFATLILFVLPASASAHFTSPGASDIRQDGSVIEYVLDLEHEGLLQATGGREDEAAISGYLLDRIRVSSAGSGCTGTVENATLPDKRTIRFELRFACPADHDFAIRYEVPARNFASYAIEGATGTFVFDRGHTLLTPAAPSFASFVRVGIEHIVLGWDHVLFLVVLLLGARNLRDVIKLATVFTVAHSITLALATLGVVEVPAAIVEPLIALSIAYVAAENVLGAGVSRHRMAIVFGFGLLHGLGFAGSIEFADGVNLVSALLAFNIGIELGQAAIVALLFPLLLVMRRWDWSTLAQATAGSAAAAVGLFWFTERVFGG
jgi:HupE / UreJ protein